MGTAAIYELPVPIWISTDALEGRIPAGLGSFAFDVVMPGRGGAYGTPPTLEGVSVPAQNPESKETLVWSQRFAAFTPGPDSASTALCRIVVQTQSSGNPDSERYDLSRIIGLWFDAVRTWVEAVTGQDLDPNHRVYTAVVHGANLLFVDPPRTSDGPVGMTLTTPQILPLSAENWHAILGFVAAGTEIPLEEQLSRDSRAAFARGHLRRSIIDAASAAEIVLHRVLSAQASPGDMPNGALRRKLETLDKQPLGGLVTLARAANLDLGIELDALEELSEVRNAAIHRGEDADYERASRTVQGAIDLIGTHGAWKRP
ncbi:hypothetical protein [Paenarthrobacter nicotinovorans]|uniref:hypothetical protein n=1 Tax=Paenarthrobacter nicotinovorans TaxID=29320 RepID=UPI003A7FEB32